MGNLEKVVVLAVLFLAAIVLAISLNNEVAKSESPDGTAEVVNDSETAFM